MNDLVVTIGGFVVLLLLIVSLRIASKSKLEIKTGDIVLALIPIALWLLVTGKIKAFEIGGFKLESAFTEASRAEVSTDLTDVRALPVERIRPGPKGSIDQIGDLIRQKTKALSFQLGYAGYVGWVIEEYVLRLAREPFLKYIVITEERGEFFGMADARRTAELVGEGRLDPDTLARSLSAVDRNALAEHLPGFIGRDDALIETASRREALERMNSLGIETLPVVDPRGQFVGVVDRSNLTASILIEIARRIE